MLCCVARGLRERRCWRALHGAAVRARTPRLAESWRSQLMSVSQPNPDPASDPPNRRAAAIRICYGPIRQPSQFPNRGSVARCSLPVSRPFPRCSLPSFSVWRRAGAACPARPTLLRAVGRLKPVSPRCRRYRSRRAAHTLSPVTAELENLRSLPTESSVPADGISVPKKGPTVLAHGPPGYPGFHSDISNRL